jgi:hypothetical protein
MRTSTPSLTTLCLLTSLAAGCGPDAAPDTSPVTVERAAYTVCDDALVCGDGEQCVLGLCLPRCGTGDACVEGAVCQADGTCGETCDANLPCTQAYTCAEGVCDADPCGHMDYWPLSIRSETHPLVVHYRDPAEESEARRSLAAVELSWDFEVNELGFTPPLLDGGACGPDEAFDIFIWRTYRGGVSDVIGANEATPWDDFYNYLILDPWGPYGGPVLEATAAHELNHAMQAVYDWNETAIFFEMTAQFVEDQVFDEADGWQEYLADFQQNPDWALDFNDDYETYYMYGSALFVFYLRDAVFGGDGSFIGEVWRRTSNEPGNNEPDMADAFESVLRERAGISYRDAVTGFARWRWFTGARDDGRHFEEGALIPDDATVGIATTLNAASFSQSLEGPMALGTVYVDVERPANLDSVGVTMSGSDGVHWVVQAMPGITPDSDGDVLEYVDGVYTIDFGTLDRRTLAFTALPLSDEGYDPENRTPDRHGISLMLNLPFD